MDRELDKEQPASLHAVEPVVVLVDKEVATIQLVLDWREQVSMLR